MNKFLTILLALLPCVTSLSAQESYTIPFSKDNYVFETKQQGVMTVSLANGFPIYLTDTLAPAVPYLPYCILRPAGCDSKNFQVEMEKELLYEDVSIQATPADLTTAEQLQAEDLRIATKSLDSPVVFGGDQKRGQYHYAYLKISPFVYDADSRNLYFVSKLTITLPSEPAATKGAENSEVYVPEVPADEIKQMVINPDDVENFYPEKQRQKSKKMITNQSEHLDYLIITSNQFAAEFEELAEWKTMRGVRAKVITTEEIFQDYNGQTSKELHLKSKLYDYYTSKGVKWVLLGGDNTIVPSLQCKIMSKTNSGVMYPITTPTDLFYACFGGAFNWDGNGNGVYGELDDNVSLYPDIYVSRLPVRKSQDATKYIKKLKRYQTWLGAPYSSKMLLAAADCDYTGSGNSAYCSSSDAMYQNFISPNAYLYNDKLYDNYSNLSGYNRCNPESLFNLINNNYHFVNFCGHGTIYSWLMHPNQNSSATIGTYQDEAALQTNTAPTVFTTCACQTSCFDDQYCCLAHDFLCNEYGGIAYLGSSRDGWGKESGALCYSDVYNGYFYQYLFTGQPSTAPRRFGALVAEAKKQLINEANSSDGCYRWLQFSINPMGDPELQIFTSTPSPFFGINTLCQGHTVKVKSSLAGDCTFVLRSIDGGETDYRVVHHADSCVFEDVTFPFTVTVNKDNYITHQTDTIYPLGSIEGPSIVCGSQDYSISDYLPSNCSLIWTLENAPSDVHVVSHGNAGCTVVNENNTPMDATLVAYLWGFGEQSEARKRIVTHGPLSVTCSQAQGSYGNQTYPAKSSIVPQEGKGYVINPNCQVTLISPNFKYMNFSHTMADPTEFNYDGENTITFKMPYESTEYGYILGCSNYNSCSNFSLRFTVSPDSGNEMPVAIRIQKIGVMLVASFGYFDSQNSTLGPNSYINPWTLYIYNVTNGTVAYNGTVNGIQYFNTSGWSPGMYIISGSGNGHTCSASILF